MAYAGNQLNADKKGCNPWNYYLPDYGYYYTINELNFELIQLEENVVVATFADRITHIVIMEVVDLQRKLDVNGWQKCKMHPKK